MTAAVTTFDDLAAHLSAEALELFRQMMAIHLASEPGNRTFIELGAMNRNALIFTGKRVDAGRKASVDDFDSAALNDLVAVGLLQLGYGSRGSANYRIGSNGQNFHRYLLELEGAPINQVESEVQRVVFGSEFAAQHVGASHHLREAFHLLWSGRTDSQTISEIGDHLRKALFDITGDVVGDDEGKSEKPVDRLEAWLSESNLPERERMVVVALVELARVTLRLDQRLNHVRDQVDKGNPPVGWEETRRAAFVTATTCYELSRL